jgi:hypothetical protein
VSFSLSAAEDSQFSGIAYVLDVTPVQIDAWQGPATAARHCRQLPVESLREHGRMTFDDVPWLLATNRPSKMDRHAMLLPGSLAILNAAAW